MAVLIIICILFLILFFVALRSYVKTRDEELRSEEIRSNTILNSKETITFTVSKRFRYSNDNSIPSSYIVYSTLKFLLNLLTYEKENVSISLDWLSNYRILTVQIFDEFREISTTEEIDVSLLGKLEAKNLIIITQKYIPTKYDSYGFVKQNETYITKLILTEDGIKYCQEYEK